MSAAGDVEAASFQHPDPMPRLAEDICDRETTDPCNAIWSVNKVQVDPHKWIGVVDHCTGCISGNPKRQHM